MIEVYELLRTKEDELARVRMETEALRTVAALLLEPGDIADFLQPGPGPQASLIEENVLASPVELGQPSA
jgi:hypothetical protein